MRKYPYLFPFNKADKILGMNAKRIKIHISC